MSKTRVVRVILFFISALMVWETVSGSTFDLVFREPLKGGILLSYFAALLASVVFVAIAVYRLAYKRGTILSNGLNLLVSLCWFLGIVFCLIIIGAHAAI